MNNFLQVQLSSVSQVKSDENLKGPAGPEASSTAVIGAIPGAGSGSIPPRSSIPKVKTKKPKAFRACATQPLMIRDDAGNQRMFESVRAACDWLRLKEPHTPRANLRASITAARKRKTKFRGYYWSNV